ncbi:hypothetical protein FZC75_15735 [Sutcliffiella horikoshii]|uniref:Uncharacterized protein n=1 Tax=Sutcliffiella horikoshii TaxID=79883 RepID=A0A5D4T774_9BACI|nr:hypothetical protein FZC75_15735 [Sutcliffiella horikoshii]
MNLLKIKLNESTLIPNAAKIGKVTRFSVIVETERRQNSDGTRKSVTVKAERRQNFGRNKKSVIVAVQKTSPSTPALPKFLST